MSSPAAPAQLQAQRNSCERSEPAKRACGASEASVRRERSELALRAGSASKASQLRAKRASVASVANLRRERSEPASRAARISMRAARANCSSAHTAAAAGGKPSDRVRQSPTESDRADRVRQSPTESDQHTSEASQQQRSCVCMCICIGASCMYSAS